MAPHGPATVIGSAGRMWYKLSWWELAPGLWGKKCSPLVRWAGMIVSRASVFPLLAWRKIKLRSVKQHLLSYCCQIYILASSATQGGNVLVFFGSSNYVTAAHDWNNSKTSLSPCSQNSLGSFWIYGFPFLCSLPTIWVSPIFLLHDAAQDRFPPPPVKYIQTVLALLLFPVLCPCPPGSPLCLVTIMQPPGDLKQDGMPLSRGLTAPSLFPSWPWYLWIAYAIQHTTWRQSGWLKRGVLDPDSGLGPELTSRLLYAKIPGSIKRGGPSKSVLVYVECKTMADVHYKWLLLLFLCMWVFNICFSSHFRCEVRGLFLLTILHLRHSALSERAAKKSDIKYLGNCLSPGGLEAPGGKVPCLLY